MDLLVFKNIVVDISRIKEFENEIDLNEKKLMLITLVTKKGLQVLSIAYLRDFQQMCSELRKISAKPITL